MDKAGMLIFGIVGLGLLFLLLRGRSGYSREYTESEVLPFRPTSQAKPFSHHYTNKEVWDISWSEDGLPTKVTIHRDAVQT